ncbi:MAG: RiPP maturation radical SAM C-methyltransferase [Oscillospiraceae bacterium]|nr:RiPP maturation radical SAM C-methyltransferase [Oscillospiraceae bacterium]
MQNSNSDVVLVLMPFASLTHPSLALGCLSGALLRENISTQSLYFTLDFAKVIGLRNYYLFNFSVAYADWLFSRAAFPEMKRDDDEFFGYHPWVLPRGKLLEIREVVNRFIDNCTRQVIAHSPKIVGCSSTFHQNCASLALLRKIRETAPQIATVMGGANCEGSMGRQLHASFEWVDYVFSGEADESFPDFCRSYLAGEKIGGEGGWNRPEVFTPYDRLTGPEGGHQPEKTPRGTVTDMGGLAMPYFDDYFRCLEQNEIKSRIIPGLVLETSRGCWWGAKEPCAFCGLNGLSAKQRQKSPDKAEQEITELTKRHGISSIQITDNIIPPVHMKQLLPRFADGKHGKLTFMYEAPATLSRIQMRELSRAGVRWIQPGIEQLHDKSLAALGKPNKLYHNIRFLKAAREYGIVLAWNCLYGFPGEDDEWHGETADLIPLLSHLQAPTAGSEVRFCRFSRYFNEYDDLNLKPMQFYRHIYPLSDDELSHMAYFFDNLPASGKTDLHRAKPGLERMLRSIAQWKTLFRPFFAKDRAEPPVLKLTQNESGGDCSIHIEDTRPVAISPSFSFHGAEARIYLAADQGITLEELMRQDGIKALSERDVREILQGFITSHLMVKSGDVYISLAVPAPYTDYPPQELTPGGWFNRQ